MPGIICGVFLLAAALHGILPILLVGALGYEAWWWGGAMLSDWRDKRRRRRRGGVG